MMQAPPARSLLAESDWPLVFVAAAVIAATVALVSIWISRPHSLRVKVIWTIAVVLIPVLGPLAWFILGREARRPA
jgi:hypothetical protein